jgi:DNA-binding MarR family transcriptional regulator
MESHQSGLRGIATTFGWTWYRMRRLIDAYLACEGASTLRAFLVEQPSRSTDISSFFDQAPRSVTQARDALEHNGLVFRSPAPDDRRFKLMHITDAGQATLGLVMPLYDVIVGQAFGSLTADEIEGLDAAIEHLNRLVDHLEAKASVPETQVPAATTSA